MNSNKNIVVYGSGFAALLISCNLVDKGHTVSLVSPKKSIGGILNPLTIFEDRVDIGPQFMENLNSDEKNLLERYIDKDQYRDIGLSYGSFYNGNYSSDFGIPDLTDLSEAKKKDLLDANVNFLKINPADLTLKELLNLKYGSLSNDFIKLSEKFLVNDVNNLASNNYNYLEFGGRIRIYDDEISKKLKKDPVKDKIIAVSREIFSDNSFSLYPRKGPLGQLIESMLSYLIKNNAEIIKDNFLISTKDSFVSFGDKKSKYDLLFIASDHLSFMEDREIYSLDRPCLFHYLNLDSKPDISHYYYMNYDLDMIHTRATNYFNYHNSSNNNKFICIEQPVTKIKMDKETIEAFQKKAISEYEDIFEQKLSIIDAKSVFTPKTFPLWKPNAINEITENLKQVISNNTNIISLPILAAQRSDALRFVLDLDL